jgi:hypothetical protein
MSKLPFTVGWEFEFALKSRSQLSQLAREMEKAGFKNELYGAWRKSPVSFTKWDLKTDRSCGNRPNQLGYEAVSPVLSSLDALKAHAQVGQLIAQVGGTINPRCGLHYHFGVTGYADKFVELLKFLFRYEDAFFMIVPPVRRNCYYCARIPLEFCRVARRHANVPKIWQDKNTWANFKTFDRLGTVEFRLFPGTLDPDYVVACALFLSQVLNQVLNHNKRVRWGKARAKDNLMMFNTFLQQAGFYSAPDSHTVLARKWAQRQYKLYTECKPDNPQSNTPASGAEEMLPLQDALELDE